MSRKPHISPTILYKVQAHFGRSRNRSAGYSASFTAESGETKTLILDKSEERAVRSAKDEAEKEQILRKFSKKLKHRQPHSEGPKEGVEPTFPGSQVPDPTD